MIDLDIELRKHALQLAIEIFTKIGPPKDGKTVRTVADDYYQFIKSGTTSDNTDQQ